MFGIIEKGKLQLDNPLSICKFEGKRFEIKILRKKRSNNENRYYWGVLIPIIADSMGEDDLDFVHEILRTKYLYEVKIVTIGNHKKEFKKLRSTADLSIHEFEEYMTKCRMWASKFLSCYVPLPNETEFTY